MIALNTEPMHVLLVGLGNRGNMWAEVIDGLPDAVLSGAMDIDPQRRAVIAQKYPGIPIYDTLGEALTAAGHDAVVLVTPPDGHLAQAEQIFAAGLPLIAEKPLTVSLPDSIKIVAMAEAANLPLTICLNFRYLPVSQAKRRLVLSGDFGAPGMGQFVYQRNRDGLRPGLNRYPLSMQHPMMLEQSIHHLDLIRYCYDREVVSLSCRTWNPPWSMYAHDSSVQCLLTMEGGLQVNYIGTWTSGWNEPHFLWRTDCADGVIIQRDLFTDIATAARTDTTLTPVPITDARAYYDDTAALLKTFIEARRAGSATPCDGRDHLRTLALCFAGIESSASGTIVDMRQFYERNGLSHLI
ncbi:Gfo/Idh/MocA family protein [Microvirga antarctica]|uniref:Gfo/Idh/MocA family protein n=1 Tax=Microvirga antarctica TaxID=2819233 RepID=UPI001B300484|nr:Gfo/Idh/MocA family oxidoreductase [Microvirga antarctica]